MAAIEEQILAPRTSRCQTGRFALAAAAAWSWPRTPRAVSVDGYTLTLGEPVEHRAHHNLTRAETVPSLYRQPKECGMRSVGLLPGLCPQKAIALSDPNFRFSCAESLTHCAVTSTRMLRFSAARVSASKTLSSGRARHVVQVVVEFCQVLP